ncbi:MAG: hypothetical protein HQK86_10785 [Nitrospinae bacterium]|nr:hypothetical protein [Nitrospinota bacterium]
MSRSLFVIPEKDGQALFHPPLSEYPRLVTENMASANGVKIGGESLDNLKREAHGEILRIAGEYTRSLGLEADVAYDSNAPIIASGHQPSMFHPGVAIKTMALTQAATQCGATPLFITVDHDDIDASSVNLPTIRDGRLVKTGHTLFPSARGRVMEKAGVEGWDVTRARLNSAAQLMESPRLAAPRSAMEEFIRRLDNHPPDSAPNYVELAIHLRRAWERPVNGGYLEIPVSAICRTRTFLHFADSIMEDIEKFAGVYNRRLELYRKEHGLRYPANPFPNLGKLDDSWESPFWTLSGDGRERLYVTPGGRIVTQNGSTDIPVGDIAGGGVAIRPRAITLSLYMRLMACDLFIHGVGGAKYDQVTDGIIREYYGVTPPVYGVVSATLHPEIEAEDPSTRIEGIKTRLREIEQRPEHEPELASNPLKREKEALVEAMGKPDADRKTLGVRIKELNRQMAGLLKPLADALNAELVSLGEIAREWDVKSFRDYPFFIHKPERVATCHSGHCHSEPFEGLRVNSA